MSGIIHRRLLSTAAAKNDFAHCVIGGGVVGLAVAARLSKRGPTVLLERHEMLGTETSARNSEVIHAGIYYPADSLKTKLCIRGKQMLYEACGRYAIPHKRTGKWIVAQDDAQRQTLQEIYDHCKNINVPIEWVSEEQAKRDEPEVLAKGGVLQSPTTGIISAHDLMNHLHGIFVDNGGDTAILSSVSALEKNDDSSSKSGYKITIKDADAIGMDPPYITSDVVVNAAGLGACEVSNLLLPKDRHVKPYYAKGTYFSYGAKLNVKRLIFPAPVKDLGGLGTHLTLDLAGRVRFGPDVEWIDDPEDIVPKNNSLEAAVEAVMQYLPNVDKKQFVADYSGIRPKLAHKIFQDFIIRQEEGFPGFVNLLGIESPGLTSSLAIGEMVEEILYN